MAKDYNVYALIRNKKAVYIGCSKDLSNRIKRHRMDKNFDSHTIINSYKTKKEALNAENSIIRFLTLFGDGNWYNAENILLAYERDFYIR